MAPTAQDKKAAEELKAEGNALFQKGKYTAAAEKYTEAITLSPGWSVLYINRAMCARKREEWGRVAEDAARALELEKDLMKGHYLAGLAAGKTGQYERATQHLRKALEAAREANDSIKDEIWRELASARYSAWQAESTARRVAHGELRKQLAATLGSADPQSLPAGWEDLFRMASWQDTPTEAPSLFTCPLTMEIFRDPVVSPSGRSYERTALLEHLKKVGAFDPITRQPVREEQLVPNTSLRAAIELYLEEHPWAWGEVK